MRSGYARAVSGRHSRRASAAHNPQPPCCIMAARVAIMPIVGCGVWSRAHGGPVRSHSSKDDAAATALETWLRGPALPTFSSITAPSPAARNGRRSCATPRVPAASSSVSSPSDGSRRTNVSASSRRHGTWASASFPCWLCSPAMRLRASGWPRCWPRIRDSMSPPASTADGRLDLARDPEIERRLETGLRAAGALSKVGLDPEAFAIDRKLRPMPFPGLASFGDDDADAALFYGRSREIADALEELAQSARRTGPAAVRDPRGVGRRQVVAAQGRHHPAPAPRVPGVAAAAGVPAGCRSAAQFRRSPGA